MKEKTKIIKVKISEEESYPDYNLRTGDDFSFPLEIYSKIKKVFNDYGKVQSFLRELVRIGYEEKEYYEKEQINDFINNFII